MMDSFFDDKGSYLLKLTTIIDKIFFIWAAFAWWTQCLRVGIAYFCFCRIDEAVQLVLDASNVVILDYIILEALSPIFRMLDMQIVKIDFEFQQISEPLLMH